jgi:hypothetical protein
MRKLLLAALMLTPLSADASDAISDELLITLFEQSKSVQCQTQCEVRTKDNDRMYLEPIKSADGRALYKVTYIDGYCGSSGCYGAVLERKADRFVILGEIQGITPKWIEQLIAQKRAPARDAGVQQPKRPPQQTQTRLLNTNVQDWLAPLQPAPPGQQPSALPLTDKIREFTFKKWNVDCSYQFVGAGNVFPEAISNTLIEPTAQGIFVDELAQALAFVKDRTFRFCAGKPAQAGQSVFKEPAAIQLNVTDCENCGAKLQAIFDPSSTGWAVRFNQYALERQEQLKRSRTAEATSAGREKTLQQISAGLLQVARTPEDQAIVQQVLANLKGRNVQVGPGAIECASTYDYLGGSIAGRSIEGAMGLFLVQIIVLFKGNGTISPGSWTASICGNPDRVIRAGENSQFTVRGAFRKYDTGWKLEGLQFD